MRLLEKERPNEFEYYYFDSVGVPSTDKMIEQYGSGENWQKETIDFWVKKISDTSTTNNAILDGQMRISFIIEACKKYNITNFEIILFDCEYDIRSSRLIDRGHARLVNQDMLNWANYLRDESSDLNLNIIDTSHKTLDSVVDEFYQMVK